MAVAPGGRRRASRDDDGGRHSSHLGGLAVVTWFHESHAGSEGTCRPSDGSALAGAEPVTYVLGVSVSTTSSPPPRLAKWFDGRLHAGPSRIHGRGVLTRAAVQAGEILMRWGGVLIALVDYDTSLFRPTSTTHYDEGRCLTTPADEPWSLDELLNHSCDPNAWLLDEVTLAARRAIDAGCEVTADFATWEDSGHVLAPSCACGAPLCRGRVTGGDWRLPALQSHYLGHFLPYLNRRIAALSMTSEARMSLET
jgi:uncharacterized protein